MCHNSTPDSECISCGWTTLSSLLPYIYSSATLEIHLSENELHYVLCNDEIFVLASWLEEKNFYFVFLGNSCKQMA